jgi:hypothetical protein
MDNGSPSWLPLRIQGMGMFGCSERTGRNGKEGRHLFADVKEIAWSPREPLLLALRPRWDGLWSVRLVEPGTWRLWEAPWPPGARPVDWRP